MKIVIIMFCLFSLNIVLSQITIQQDTTVIYNSEAKFEFERWNNSRRKKLKSGKGIEVNLNAGDSTYIIYGSLYEANQNSIQIEPLWENIKLDTSEFYYSSITNHFENSLATIPIQNINSLKYDANYVIIPFSIAYLSLISATIVAPLVSIDKNSPNNFNSKRFKSIILPSLIGAGIGFTIGYALKGGKNRFKLKPTLLN